MKPKMILAMPSSGSDLLVSCIQKSTGFSYFQKEFFNPITNLPMCDELLDMGFGCETVAGSKNLWRPPTTSAERLGINSKWEYQLWKEVFWFGKFDFFDRHFDCILLHRTMEDMFPPSRLRVLQWYDSLSHIVTAEKGKFLQRVTIGYQNASKCITLLEAQGVPCLSLEDLRDGRIKEVAKIRDWLEIDFECATNIVNNFHERYNTDTKENIKYPVRLQKDGFLDVETK